MIYYQKVTLSIANLLSYLKTTNSSLTLTDAELTNKIVRFLSSTLFYELDKSNMVLLTQDPFDSTTHSNIGILGTIHLESIDTVGIKIKILPTSNNIDFNTTGTIVLAHNNKMSDYSKMAEFNFIYLATTYCTL